MSKMIQLRNVPDRLHRILKARAAQAGKPLSDYLLEEVAEAASRPTLADLLDRIRRRSPVKTFDAARAVRAERQGRR